MKKGAGKNIHDGHRERLRISSEKDPELLSFSDFEVLEYLLSVLIPRKDTNPIAHDLIDNFGSFYGVLSATSNELFEIKNMTKVASNFLPNLLSVVRCAERSRISRSYTVNCVGDAEEVFYPYFLGRSNELFYMMMLDINEQVISVELISKGTSNYTSVDMARIAAKVSRSYAHKVIVAHNHPGGNDGPSPNDVLATSAISHLLNTMGRVLVDHLIFTNDKFVSFYHNSAMDKLIINADRILGTNMYKEVQNRTHVDMYVCEKEGFDAENSDLQTRLDLGGEASGRGEREDDTLVYMPVGSKCDLRYSGDIGSIFIKGRYPKELPDDEQADGPRNNRHSGSQKRNK